MCLCVSQVQFATVLGRRRRTEHEQTHKRWRFPYGAHAKYVLKKSDIKMGIFQMTAGQVKLKGLDALSVSAKEECRVCLFVFQFKPIVYLVDRAINNISHTTSQSFAS